MGCCGSTAAATDKHNDEGVHRVLVIGPVGSGKSKIVRQWRFLLHNNDKEPADGEDTVEKLSLDNGRLEVFDMPGTLCEGPKYLWKEQQDIDTVLFVAALSDYDQHDSFDNNHKAASHNRMTQALELFGAVYQHFSNDNASMVLFLNKKDLFAKKLAEKPLANNDFSDYAGPPADYNMAVLYLLEKFKDCAKSCGGMELDDSNIHVTCALDTDSVASVLGGAVPRRKNQSLFAGTLQVEEE